MSSVKNIIENTHYQTFDFLGGSRKDSLSGEKYKMSRLDDYDINGKNILDVGCNAGYFLFRLTPKNPNILVGIDLGENFINTANELNKEYFKSDKLRFIFGDFFSFNFEEKFDLIFCFSTFHYFGDKQKDFFDKCFDLLNDKGILLVEIEEYPENKIPEINNTPRPADKKKYNYPNELKIREFISEKFNILDKYISTKQGGSLYDRQFYKLKKI